MFSGMKRVYRLYWSCRDQVEKGRVRIGDEAEATQGFSTRSA